MCEAPQQDLESWLDKSRRSGSGCLTQAMGRWRDERAVELSSPSKRRLNYSLKYLSAEISISASWRRSCATVFAARFDSDDFAMKGERLMERLGPLARESVACFAASPPPVGGGVARKPGSVTWAWTICQIWASTVEPNETNGGQEESFLVSDRRWCEGMPVCHELAGVTGGVVLLSHVPAIPSATTLPLQPIIDPACPSEYYKICSTTFPPAMQASLTAMGPQCKVQRLSGRASRRFGMCPVPHTLLQLGRTAS